MLSILIWFSLFIRRNRISLIVQELYSCRKRYKQNHNVSAFKRKMTVILILMIFITQLLHHFDYKLTGYVDFWSMGFKAPEGGLRIIFIIFVNSVIFIQNSFPFLMTFILNAMLTSGQKLCNHTIIISKFIYGL